MDNFFASLQRFFLRFIKGSRALKAHTTAYSIQFQEYVMWLHTEQGCVQQQT